MWQRWLTAGTAGLLVLGSLAVMALRYTALGHEVGNPTEAPTWNVTLTAIGSLTAKDAAVIITLPPDFRTQHISDERFQSDQLSHRLPRRSRASGRRTVVWRRPNPAGVQPFEVRYSFQCQLGVRRPPSTTRLLDAAPGTDDYLRPTARIQSAHPEIVARARRLCPDDVPPTEQLRRLFDDVVTLDDGPARNPDDALGCLRQWSGDAAARSRLLVALCRSRGFPARLLSGLVLENDRPAQLHCWVEAWVNRRWLPMCPTHEQFDSRQLATRYLVLRVGDGDLVRCRGGQVHYALRLDGGADAGQVVSGSRWQAFWRRLSLSALQPAEQHLVKFLLLLPVAALIVCFFRTVIGVPTFGTFSPALVGLAFHDVKALPWGLPVFVGTVLVGWGIRHLLDRYRLLQVPRVSAMLTLIVIFLIGMVVVASHAGVASTDFVALFPLVILTHLVERFWTVEAEDGTAASFRTLGGTMLVAVVISLALSPEIVTTWMFRFPETLGIVLAAQLLLGRYLGYRLSELYRFRDFVTDERQVPGSAA